jgi:hypothetical protein
MRRSVYPFFEHATEVLPTDCFDNPLPDEVIPKLGQSPAVERQAQGRWRLARQAPDGVDLPLGEARRSPHLAPPAQRGKTVLGEIAEVGRDGIDMHLEQLCHRGGGQARDRVGRGWRRTWASL